MKNQRSIDLKAIAVNAMRKYGFEPVFPDSVIKEVNSIHAKPLPGLLQGTKDLRMLLWSSIDNYDSMDLDQLEFCERGQNGEIEVKIAIADVDAYVPKQSHTDQYAAHNGTSVYTGIETFPMLPDKLSKGITSLLPGNDHQATVIEYTVLQDGRFHPGDIYRALVSNKAKLVYEEVGNWLEGNSPIPQTVREVPGLEEQIRLQTEAIQRLKKNRRTQGALELNTIEAEAVMLSRSLRLGPPESALEQGWLLAETEHGTLSYRGIHGRSERDHGQLPWQCRYTHDSAGCSCS